MATTLPYNSASSTRVRAQTRAAPKVDRRIAVIITIVLTGVLLFAMLQLWLASEVASTLLELAVLEQQKSDRLAVYDALRIRAEELKSPSVIETKAIKEKLVPVPFDFVP
jgi:hypothetical protein